MALIAALLSPLPASAVTAVHEISANWLGDPASVPYGTAIISEWHISTNDANDPEANDPVDNVRLTLTATNGAFSNIPAVCKLRDVTPVSAISANGTQLLCNLGTINEGTATVLQAPVRPNGAVGSALSLSGTVTSDSAGAPTPPTAPPGLTITGSHGMDLVLSAPNQNYQQSTIASRSGGNRPSVVVDYGVAMTTGSVPGPSTYVFTVDIAVSVAGQLTGLQWEGCAPVDNSAQATGIPYSDPGFANRTNAPTCSISGTGTHYTVTLSGLDYTLQHVPTVDSLGNAIPSATTFIAAGQLLFSYTTPITTSTGVTFGATPSQFTFIDGVTQPETNTSNDVSGTTLVLPGVFAISWQGGPTVGRSPWDANLWAAPGAAQNLTLPWPPAGTSTDPGPYTIYDEPLVSQADSVTWSTYSGAGGPDMAGSCSMVQNPAAFRPKWADFVAADGALYTIMTTVHLWYRTDVFDTKTETCGEPVGVAGSPWIAAPLPAGCATQTLPISPAYSDDQCIVSLPAGVTAVKMTWDPAVDTQFHHFLRVWGDVPTTATAGMESWTVGAFNAPYDVATVFPGYPVLNNYINISTNPNVIAIIPGSTYGPNTNGIRDAMRIQGPNGAITKTTPSATAAPGESVTYDITAESDVSTANPPNQTFTVTDTLPIGMSYVAGSGTPTPTLSINGSGQQVLSYTFTNVPANTPQPITYQAQVAANGTVAPGTVLTNTAQIDVPGDNRPDAAKRATASITVPNNGATTLGKSVESSILSFYGDSSAWDLTINSFDPTSNAFTDTIDILPNIADGRGTNIDGTYSITGVTAPAGATIYYSTAPIASLSNDPRDASNGGTPGSIAGNTVGWSTTAVANPTAIRVIAPALAAGAAQTIRIAFSIPAGASCSAPSSTDNKPGQKLVNSANTIAGHTALPMLSSSETVIGDCAALIVKKYVLVDGGDPGNPGDWHDADTPADYQQYAIGETIPYKVVVTNTGTATLTNIDVVDDLASGCDVAIATLAAGVAQTQTCTMTAVVGTTVNTATASVTPAVGPPLSVSDGAGVIVPTAAQVATTKALTGESGTQPGIAEPGETLTYTITLTNTGGSPALNYEASDQLDTNTTFVSASNGGAATAGVVNWTGLTVPANGTLALTVSVTVNSPIPPGVTQLANVAYETGTAPPPCPPAGPQCVVTPTASEVTITKSVVDANGSGIADPGEQLTYTILLTNSGGSDAVNYGVTDPLNPNVAFVSASNGGAFAGGVVNWTGLTVPAGGNLALTVVVTVANPIPSGVTTIGNVAYETGGPPPDCSALPTPPNCNSIPTAPQVAIAKSAGTPTPTGNPNEFQITYVATVTNGGGSVGLYDLSDTLTFNGATVTAISAPTYGSTTGDTENGTPGSFVPPGGGTIVTGEDINPAGSETWTYTVTYTIDDPLIAGDCTSVIGGLRNSAALGGGAAGAPPAETCTGAPNVAIVKTASVPAPTGNPNEYALTYTVNVANTGTLPGVYDLSDVLTFNGATLTAIGTPAYSSSSGDTQDGTLGPFGLPDGGVIVTGESISAGGTETWTYTVTYTVDVPAVAEDCADPNGGLRNSAALGGSFGGSSTTCTGAPAVVIGKSASGPTATGNPGEYTLTYLVTVQNNGTLDGLYDLSDAFTFPGVSNVSVSAVAHNGPDPLGTTLGTLTASGGTIVTDEPIAAGSSESYTYSVVFTVDDPALVGTCAGGGGLLNDAMLGGSSSGQVATCTDVPDVTIAKTATAPTPTGTLNQYTLDYVVTVSNDGAATGTYDLSDAFAFAGATIDAVSAVTHGGPDPLTTTLGTLTASGGTIVTGEPIAATSSETYAYTVTFTITDPASADDCSNSNGGLRNAADLGGSASGSSATCTGAPVIVIDKVLSGESGSIAGVAEPGEQLTYTITLTNSGGVDETNYGVTDTLDPNVTFVSADNGGTESGGVVTWNGLTVPAGGSLALTVVVAVADPIPSGVDTIGNLAYETGGTPPDCGSTPRPPNCVVTPAEGVVSIAKSVVDANGNGVAEPGETLTYTIVLTNTNGGDVTNYAVTDPLDPNVVFVSADNGGTESGGVVTWNGLTVPAGGSLSLTVVVTVADPLPAGVTTIGNLAYESGGTPPDCSSLPRPPNCNVIPVPAPGDVTITKSVADANGNGVAEPGEALTYSIVLTNTGGQDVVDYGVTDPLDPNVVFVSADNGGSESGGVVSWSGLTVPTGGSVTLTLIVTVANPLPAGVTTIGNLAYETGGTPPDCASLPTPPNCAEIVVPPAGAPELLIEKTADSTTLQPGGTVVYTITISNIGTAPATNAMISDPIPAGIASFAWSCSASGGAMCPNASGSGAIEETVAMFPAGGVLVYTVAAVIDASPPTTITNTASATPPGIGVCAPSGSPPPCESTVIGNVTPPAGRPPVATPAADEWALLLLGIGLLGLAWRTRRTG